MLKAKKVLKRLDFKKSMEKCIYKHKSDKIVFVSNMSISIFFALLESFRKISYKKVGSRFLNLKDT